MYKYMIYDKISNLELYKNVNQNFSKAFEWFIKTDINSLKVGEKILVDGEHIWAKVDEYDTKQEYELLYEGHIKYIDIQFILDGNELMKIKLKNGDENIDIPYDNIKERYKTRQVRSDGVLDVKKDEFVIFFPDDLHNTQISATYRNEKVKRLIIKVETI